MSEHKFSEGDEVQHKTGKIKMIYVGESQLGDAICEWVDPSGRPQRATFAHAALEKYEKPTTTAFQISRA